MVAERSVSISRGPVLHPKAVPAGRALPGSRHDKRCAVTPGGGKRRTKRDWVRQLYARAGALLGICSHCYPAGRLRGTLKYLIKMVLPDRIELSTSPLPMECSTTELRQQTKRGYRVDAPPQSAVPCHTDFGSARMMRTRLVHEDPEFLSGGSILSPVARLRMKFRSFAAES